MTEQEIENLVRRAFQSSGLIVSEPDALARAGLPPSSSRFLLSVGLPKGEISGFDFAPVQLVPALDELEVKVSADMAARRDWQQFRCVADQYPVLMAVDPAKNGKVVLVDFGSDQLDVFVNSTVELLGACLAEYALLRRGRVGEMYGPRVADDLRNRLLEIDPPAVDGWWGIVIQEVEFGLM